MADPKITGVDWDMINKDAESWAREYGGDLVKKIDKGTRRDVGNAVGNFYSEGQTMGELTDRLGRIYSPQRAERIAITEVTRAAAEGERGIAKELAKDGIVMVEIWQTRNDLVVCEICRPRNGIEQGKGSGDAYWDGSQGPPGHPNCRCNIRLDYPKPKEGAVATTTEQAENWARDKQLAEHIDYSGVTPDAASIINNEIYNHFGTNSPIRRIVTGAGQDVRGLQIMMEVTDDLDFIVYDLAKDPKTVAKLLAENQATFVNQFGNKTAMVAKDFQDMVIHEMGHAADFNYSKTQKLKRFWYAEKIGGKPGNFADMNKGILTNSAKQEAAILSDYATSSTYEYFAESWLAAKSGRADLLPAHILEILMEAGL